MRNVRQQAVGSWLLMLVLSGCHAELDQPEVDAEIRGDGGNHASDGAVVDAGPGIDAARDAGAMHDAPSDSDARATLDANTEAARLDAATCSAVSTSCAPRGAPVVRCGDATCSGATPFCCSAARVARAPYCAADPQGCWSDGGAVDNSLVIIDRCDDTSDCAEGEYCLDGWNKGVWRRNGGRCSAGCRDNFPVYLYQRCSIDCECSGGVRCINGCCGSCIGFGDDAGT